MNGEERAILIAAQKKAMDILATSAAAAQKVASEAEADAVALMLEQRKQAGALFKSESEHIAQHGYSEEEARHLLDANEAAAGLLAGSQADDAARQQQSSTNAAVDVLMAGQREAAAVLLDAWMRVTESRTSAED